VRGETTQALVQGCIDAKSKGFTAVGHLTPFLDSPREEPYFETHVQKMQRAIDRVRQYREAVGNEVDLCIEIHRRLSPAEAIVRLLITEKSHIKPVAAINAHGGSKKVLHGVPVVGKMNLFEKTIADHAIDIIIQVDHLEQSLNIINYALANNIKYLMPPELLGIFQGHQMIEEVEGMPFLKLHKKKHWWHNIW